MTVIKKFQANGPTTRQHRSMQEVIVKSVNKVKIGDRIKNLTCSSGTDGLDKGHQEKASNNTTRSPHTGFKLNTFFSIHLP